MSVVMVTGAFGYIGRHVVAEIVKRGHRVLAVDVVGNNMGFEGAFYKGDLLHDAAFVQSLPAPDVLVHLAWQDGFKHTATSHMRNIGAHYDFVCKMVDRGVRHVVVMGSMHEVGYHEGAIVDDTPCKPLSLYGIAKNALREALLATLSNQPVCFQWLRGYYIYGDDTFNHSIFTKLLEAAAAGKKTFPFTSGENKYDFVQVDELAKMIVATALQDRVTGVINCCSGMPRSLGEVVEKFIVDHGLDVKLQYGAFPDRPYDSPGVWGDATKIRQIMGERNS